MLRQESAECISAEVSPLVYRLLEKASGIRGSTISQFLVQAAVEKAKHVIEEDETIHLSVRDAEVFFGAIDNPPRPNDRLLTAINEYQEYFHNAEDQAADQASGQKGI